MQRFFSLCLALCLALTFSYDADARRFGGGKSFGSAPAQRQVKPRTPAAAPQTPPRQPVAGGSSRWLGPLAGLAAGGLLASLFMGDSFQGLQIMDILVFGLIAFLLFRLFSARRRLQPQPSPVGAAFRQERTSAAEPLFGSTGETVAAPIDAPAWFDERRFLDAARDHFMALQQHWDANEMDKIAEYVTPQMLEFLERERAALGEGYQSTYIDDLQIQLDGLDNDSGRTVATLTFTGIAKTSRFDQGEPFSESWRMEREQGENKPWLIAGIRQNA